MEDTKIEEIYNQMKEEKKEEVMREKVEKFKEDVKNHPVLKENHIKLVDGRWYVFLKAFFIIFLVLFSCSIFYLGYNGYLTADIFINNTITTPVNNQYDFAINNDIPQQCQDIINYYNYTIITKNYLNCSG